jgi:hypothetical protein
VFDLLKRFQTDFYTKTIFEPLYFYFFVALFPPFERLEIILMKCCENISPRRNDDDDDDSNRSQITTEGKMSLDPNLVLENSNTLI